MRDADQILVLSLGRIVERGRHEDLRAVTFVVPRGTPLKRLRLKVCVHGATTAAGRIIVRR